MNHLHRDLAPLTEEAWSAVEEEATRTLATQLAARGVVDVDGPHGWERSAVPTGRTESVPDVPAADGAGARARLRGAQPLVELRVPFDLDRETLESIPRGDAAPDLEPVVEAARALARVESRAVFHGWEKACIEGIVERSPHAPLPLSGDGGEPHAVALGLETLREGGVEGPYAMVMGPRAYARLQHSTGEGGFPVIQHVRRLFDGPVVWTPSLEGAALLSLRGGDFALTLGQDVSVGYLAHDAEHVRLYLEESFTFRPIGPEAAVPLADGPA